MRLNLLGFYKYFIHTHGETQSAFHFAGDAPLPSYGQPYCQHFKEPSPASNGAGLRDQELYATFWLHQRTPAPVA